ncbi:transglutaminase-like cysteine peptidase [Rhizorhabdus argentea]|uniref:transglutaminase-like cysteine peptidase n=1 Tax=Rhizorhabdus argentea TaxID=1387174 RepID=UPI0030EC320F
MAVKIDDRARRAIGKAIRNVALALGAALTLSACTTTTQGASAMRDGGLVMPPAGWMDFCGRNADDPSCKVVQLDETRLKQLRAVQSAVRQIHAVDDRKEFGRAEYWQVASKAGDCEDIALAAREKLMAMGWPASAVRLATAWTEQRAYHTVLTIDVARDGAQTTLVLDSRFPTVMSWQRLEQIGYRFHIRQASRGPTWVSIRS